MFTSTIRDSIDSAIFRYIVFQFRVIPKFEDFFEFEIKQRKAAIAANQHPVHHQNRIDFFTTHKKKLEKYFDNNFTRITESHIKKT